VTNAQSLARRATAGPAQGMAVWGAAFSAGLAGPDDLLTALAEWAPVQSVVDGDLPGLLTDLRRIRPTSVRLLLPAPGDTRGLPAGSPVAVAATTRGEAAIFEGPEDTAVLVPVPEAGDVMRWSVFDCPGLTDPDPIGLAEAEHLLRDAVNTAATALATLPAGPDAITDARATVAELTAAIGAHRLPARHPVRAHRVLDSAAMVEAILLVAGARHPHTGLSLASAQAGDAGYRELWRTVRLARTAAINAVCRELLGGR
jgi:hypothetical protein